MSRVAAVTTPTTTTTTIWKCFRGGRRAISCFVPRIRTGAWTPEYNTSPHTPCCASATALSQDNRSRGETGPVTTTIPLFIIVIFVCTAYSSVLFSSVHHWIVRLFASHERQPGSAVRLICTRPSVVVHYYNLFAAPYTRLLGIHIVSHSVVVCAVVLSDITILVVHQRESFFLFWNGHFFILFRYNIFLPVH